MINEALLISSNLICFIDDDEFPKADWLVKHLSALIQYNADVVTGPVIPIADEGQIKNFKSSKNIKKVVDYLIDETAKDIQ